MGTLAGHRYVTRVEWGARSSTEPLVRISLPTLRLWVHHTGDDRQGAAAVRAHQAFHQDARGWKDIAYTYLVGADGTIFEGRGHQYVGGATQGDNSTSHAICLLGNFNGHGVPAAQWRALVDLVRHGRDNRWWVPTCGGHRDAPGAQTACPGDQLYRRLAELRQAILLPTPPPVEDDMFDPNTHGADLAAVKADVAKIAAAVYANAKTPGQLERQIWAERIDNLGTVSGAAADYMRRLVRGLDAKALAAELAELVDATPGTLTGAEVEAIVDGALARVLTAAASAADD